MLLSYLVPGAQLTKQSLQVEFRVNNAKQDHSMKLGEGGEAFFVFETSDEIPESLQTSPVISPATSPQSLLEQDVASVSALQEPEFLDLNMDGINDRRRDTVGRARPILSDAARAKSDFGMHHLITRVRRSNHKNRCTYSTIYQLWGSFRRCWE